MHCSQAFLSKMNIERSDVRETSGDDSSFDKIESGNTLHSKSVEGWVVIIRNIHEEAQEDDIIDLFSDCGPVKNIHLNLDRRFGMGKGYALMEFGEESEAMKAIQLMDGFEYIGKRLKVDWAFVAPPKNISS